MRKIFFCFVAFLLIFALCFSSSAMSTTLGETAPSSPRESDEDVTVSTNGSSSPDEEKSDAGVQVFSYAVIVICIAVILIVMGRPFKVRGGAPESTETPDSPEVPEEETDPEQTPDAEKSDTKKE